MNVAEQKGEVVIGVTGHRVLAERGYLTSGIDSAVREVEAAFPGKTLTVLSALAAGADQIVVRRVLERPGAALIAVLPLPISEYAGDFDSEEEKKQFFELLARAAQVIELAPEATRDRAYQAAGEYVLSHCDVLIALWDGRAAQGRGGTGAIVNEARERGLPLVWVHAGNRRPGTLEPTSLGEEQGMVTFENLSKPI